LKNSPVPAVRAQLAGEVKQLVQQAYERKLLDRGAPKSPDQIVKQAKGLLSLHLPAPRDGGKVDAEFQQEMDALGKATGLGPEIRDQLDAAKHDATLAVLDKGVALDDLRADPP